MSSPLKVWVLAGRNLAGKTDGKSNPFCEVFVLDSNGQQMGRPKTTRAVASTVSPQWNELTEFQLPSSGWSGITVRVWDKHRFWSNKFLGQVTMKFNLDVLAKEQVESWLTLGQRAEKREAVSGEIQLRVQWKNAPAAGSSAAAAAAAKPAPPVVIRTDSKQVKDETEPLTTSTNWDTQNDNLSKSGAAFVVIDQDKPPADAEDDEGLENHRQGAPAVSLEAENAGKLTLTGTNNLTVANNSSYQLEKARGSVRVNGGTWWFEVKVTSTSSQLQIGWAEERKTGNTWAWDVGRRQLVNKETYVSGQYGEAISNGDLIGCGIDLKARRIYFTKNGNTMGDAFGGAASQKMAAASGRLVPMVGTGRGGRMEVNFGREPFAHPVSGFAMLHSFLTEKEMAQLMDMFNHYKELGIKLSESGDTGDVVKGSGTLQLLEDIGVNPETDAGALVLAWKCKAETAWVFTREEWINGMSVNQVCNTEQLKKKIKPWTQEAIKGSKDVFQKFYVFCFDHLRGDKKILLTEEAIMVWDLIFKPRGWKLYDKWIQFHKETEKKSVSRDTWDQLVPFSLENSGADLSNYDWSSSWPSIMDEFAEWCQKK